MSVGFSADTDDDGSGTTGTIRTAAWKAAMGTAIDALVGNWAAVTFDAGDFTGSGSMTVTVQSGDVKRNRCQTVNKCLHWQFTGRGISVGGTPSTQILFQTPFHGVLPLINFSDSESRSYNVQVSDNGTYRNAYALVVDATHLGIVLESGGNFAAAANTTDIAFDIAFETTT